MTAFSYFMIRLRKLVELLAVAVACVLIWDGGVPGRIDLFPSVTSPMRVAMIVAAVMLWLGGSWWQFRRSRVAAGKLFDTLGDAGAASDSALEADELRQPLAEALAMLREQGKDRLGHDYATVLPWFLVLGPPGAGKASLVEGSGLPMPLEEQFGRRGLRTRIAGGTRWWFTDEALLISPQGTAIAGAAPGGAPQWRNLLDFLVERRRRRPVDGVLLVVDADRLLGGEGRQTAAMLRVRLQEAMRRFGARLQVYLVISKADLPGRGHRLHDRRIVVPLSRAVHPARDDPFPQGFLGRRLQRFRAERAVEPAVEVVDSEQHRHPVMVGLQAPAPEIISISEFASSSLTHRFIVDAELQ